MAKLQISLKARALKYLSSREHSRLELRRKLVRYANENDDIDAILNWLEKEKFLSAERFSEALANRRATRYGNSRILMELQSHGIEKNALEQLKSHLIEGEAARAQEVLRKKFKSNTADVADRAKQIRFLQQRGFSMHAIQSALQTILE